MSTILEGFAADPAAADAPYLQIRRRIASDIAGGAIAVGEKLPSVRALAAQLNLAVNTVARVYKELESAGLVETRGRAGTVVTSRGSRTPAKVLDAAARLARLASDAAMDDDAVLALVRSALAEAR